MRYAHAFIPTLKEAPQEASIISHQLMLRAGLVQQAASGLYNWLPLGLRVLHNIQSIIRRHLAQAGVQELLMPTLQATDLWEESGRLDAFGKEMLRAEDRHGRTLIYSPTNEEVITAIFRSSIKSYKQLPQSWYQMQWKFRDEIRPRFGVMRAREFLMKDAYSFDVDEAAARETYARLFSVYQEIFTHLGVRAIPVQADTGAIGGSLSHEFHVLAETGESAVYYDKAFESYGQDAVSLDKAASLYAMADEMHQPDACPIPIESLREKRGIEVGHIFLLGTKYTEALGADVALPDGQTAAPFMGCYGIGISRLVGAIIEAHHDDNGIIWPEAVAPYKVVVQPLMMKDAATVAAADALYNQLQAKLPDRVLLDDRQDRPGAKMKDADLLGLPWQIRIGPKSLEQGKVELYNRRQQETTLVTAEEAVAHVL